LATSSAICDQAVLHCTLSIGLEFEGHRSQQVQLLRARAHGGDIGLIALGGSEHSELTRGGHVDRAARHRGTENTGDRGAGLPILILLLPVVTLKPASNPSAML